MKARHIRTGNVYDVIDMDANMKIGEWRAGIVIYGRGGKRFVRTKEGFDESFEIIAPWYRWLWRAITRTGRRPPGPPVARLISEKGDAPSSPGAGSSPCRHGNAMMSADGMWTCTTGCGAKWYQ